MNAIYKFQFYWNTFKRFGIRSIFFLLYSKIKRNRLENIRIKGVKYPIGLKDFGTDVTTLFQIFFGQEYNIELKSQTASFIVDCGANIGLSAVYFANQYPHATIIAIEPDKSNFVFLQKNVQYYSNVVCLNKAIWFRNAAIEVIDNNRGNWGYQTVESENPHGHTIEGITISSIIDKYNVDAVDLLKIDIEGAERDLFSVNYEEWLPYIKVIAIELHDNIDKDIPEIFQNAVNRFSCKQYYLGENLICEFV